MSRCPDDLATPVECGVLGHASLRRADVAIPRVPGQSGRGSRVVFAVLVGLSIGMMGSSVVWGQEPPPNPTPVTDGADSQGGQAADPGGATDQQSGPDATTDPQGGQVLTQGPVHEAFAAPVVHDPKAGPIVPKGPPDPIQEMPPDQKPSGQNIQWIPGYWAWDITRNDYLWVSGIWREPPPSTQWVPGYWHQVDGGYQWVPGSWMPVSAGQTQGQVQAQGQSQATYLPPPPQSLESGPNTPQPGPNVAWTPGYWSWQQGGYVWRPGFWAAVQPNWIWIPAHYVWTPSGYLFVPGYWDLPVANRGLMFAPVYYPQPVYAQPGFVFTPSISIVGSAVTANLFVQASTNQYLFGNFYAQNFVGVGIVPWFSFSFSVGRPAYFDPLFSYYAVVNVRQNPQWIVQVRRAYFLRRDTPALRPPGTYAEQIRIERNVSITRNITVVDHRTMGMPLDRLAADPIAGRNLRMVRVSEAERQQLRHQVAQLHQVREQRLRQERAAARLGMTNRPRTMSLPHSPIAARPAGHPADHADGGRAARPSPVETRRGGSPHGKGRRAKPGPRPRRGAAAHRRGATPARRTRHDALQLDSPPAPLQPSADARVRTRPRSGNAAPIRDPSSSDGHRPSISSWGPSRHDPARPVFFEGIITKAPSDYNHPVRLRRIGGLCRQRGRPPGRKARPGRLATAGCGD